MTDWTVAERDLERVLRAQAKVAKRRENLQEALEDRRKAIHKAPRVLGVSASASSESASEMVASSVALARIHRSCRTVSSVFTTPAPLWGGGGPLGAGEQFLWRHRTVPLLDFSPRSARRRAHGG
jgi:hypothetical protein